VAGNRLLQAMLADARSCTFLLEQGVDELALPEQTALLALAYHFKSEHPDLGAAAFLDWLDDPQLMQIASSVLVEDPPPYDPELLAAYVRTVRLHLLEQAYQRVLAESVEAQLAGRELALTALRRQLEGLQGEIQRLKSAQGFGKSGTGSKEAGRE
ncbi:MAG: hypothetical protein K6T26_07075, partial [Alicyclobacillus sp.]|nr:hypothetical protein [Alicyclobacillus sp.]